MFEGLGVRILVTPRHLSGQDYAPNTLWPFMGVHNANLGRPAVSIALGIDLTLVVFNLYAAGG